MPENSETPPSRPPANRFPGIIIAASVIVAAGLAIYENEQIRHWLDENRRRIAIALSEIGEGIHPDASSRRSQSDQAAEMDDLRILETVRRNKEELMRRAREDDVDSSQGFPDRTRHHWLR